MVFQALRNQRLMKGILIVVVIAFAGSLVVFGGSLFSGSGTRTVIAKVNGAAIKATEFDQSYQSTVNYYQQVMGEIPRSAVQYVRYVTLENMITDQLLLQQVRKNGVKISATEINDELKVIKENFATDAEYKEWLEYNELTDVEVRKLIKDNLAVTKLRELKSAVEITDDDVKASFEQVKASHILIQPVNDNWDVAKTQAEKVLAEIKSGQTFAAMAKKYSADTATKDNGGDLDYFKRADMDEAFSAAAFALNVGEISQPVKSSYGYHIIKVTARKEASGAEFDTAKEALKTELQTSKSETQYNEWFAQVRSEAKIVVNDPSLRAQQYVANQQYPQAVSQYQEAIEEDASDPYLHVALGDVYRQLEDSDAALAEYEAAVALGESDAELHLVLGMAYNEKDMKDKAVASLRMASSLDTYTYSIHTQLQQLFTTLGMTEDAKAEQTKLDQIQKMYEEQAAAAEEQAKAQEELDKKLDETETDK